MFGIFSLGDQEELKKQTKLFYADPENFGIEYGDLYYGFIISKEILKNAYPFSKIVKFIDDTFAVNLATIIANWISINVLIIKDNSDPPKPGKYADYVNTVGYVLTIARIWITLKCVNFLVFG